MGAAEQLGIIGDAAALVIYSALALANLIALIALATFVTNRRRK